jgi:hypothetical protein
VKRVAEGAAGANCVIKTLQDKKLIERAGSKKAGYWTVAKAE